MTAAVTAEFIRQRLADLPEEMPALRLLVLFGSAARGGARSESDVDLAVQCDGPADLDALYQPIVWTWSTSAAPGLSWGWPWRARAVRSSRENPERSENSSRWLLAGTAIPTSSVAPAGGRSTRSWSARASREPHRCGDHPPEAPADRRVPRWTAAHRAPEPRGVPRQILRTKGDRAAAAGSDRSGPRGRAARSSPGRPGALAPSAGLRNRLVHEYETIDDAKVLAAVGTLPERYPRYIQAVESYLTKAGQ